VNSVRKTAIAGRPVAQISRTNVQYILTADLDNPNV